jgi:hypothetical protein
VNGYFTIGYLWYNAIGVLVTVVLAWLFSFTQAALAVEETES